MKLKILDKVVSLRHENELTVIMVFEDGRVAVSDGEHCWTMQGDDLIYVGSHSARSRFDLLKMYVVVVVDSNAPVGLGINGAVHAAYAAGAIHYGAIGNSCIAYREDTNKHTEEWIENSYRNVTCTGESKDIEEAIKLSSELGIPHFEFHEPDWVDADGRPLAVAFGPMYRYPEVFKKFELHGGAKPNTGHRRR